MLAPRKILWSTPDAAIEKAYYKMLRPLLLDDHDDDDSATAVASADDSSTDENDDDVPTTIILDVGCGDGRVLRRWAELYSSSRRRSSSHDDDEDDKQKPTTSGQQQLSLSPSSEEEEDGDDMDANNANADDKNEKRRAARHRQHIKFVGIDTDKERIDTAQTCWKQAIADDRILAHIPFQFHCGNALTEWDRIWNNEISTPTTQRRVTTTTTENHPTDVMVVVYVYLTPHGMRRLRPLLDDMRHHSSSLSLQVLSYMNPLPGNATLLQKEHVIDIPHQPEAAWPLYLYEL